MLGMHFGRQVKSRQVGDGACKCLRWLQRVLRDWVCPAKPCTGTGPWGCPTLQLPGDSK